MAKKLYQIEVLGQSYPALFSVYSLQLLEDEYGGLKGFEQAAKAGNLSVISQLVHSCIVSGCEYSNLLSGTDYKAPSTKMIAMELSDMEDIQRMMDVLSEMLKGMKDRDIHAVPRQSKKKGQRSPRRST